MLAVYRSSFASEAGDPCASRPVACGNDAGESAALAVALLELLDVRTRVRSGGRDSVYGGDCVWRAALRGDPGGQSAAFAIAHYQRNNAQGKYAELADPATAVGREVCRVD